MVTEGVSQPRTATACFVYVSPTTLSLSTTHFYFFYSIRVANNESCYKNKVNAPLNVEFRKSVCAAELCSAVLLIK